MPHTEPLLSRTRAGREEAASVLRTLIDTKVAAEPVLERLRSWSPAGTRPSSLSVDNAIASARRLVESFDRIMSEMELDADDLALLRDASFGFGVADADSIGVHPIDGALDLLIGDEPERRAA